MKKIFQGTRQRVRLNPAVQKLRRLIRKPFTSDLPFILTHLDPNSSLNEQIYWIEQIFEWISLSGDLPTETEAAAKSSIQVVRLKFLLHIVNRNPQWKSKLAQSLRAIVQQGSCLELFSQAGLHQEFGFWGEASDRIVKNILPTPPDAANISDFFARVFSKHDMDVWFYEVSPELLLQITELFYFEYQGEGDVFHRVRQDSLDSIVVLSATIAGVGLSKDLIRGRQISPIASPFYQLSFHVSELVKNLRQAESVPDLVDVINPCLHQLYLCREDIKSILQTLEEKGVSLAVVYKLDQLQFAIDRLETLLHLLFLRRDRDSMSILISFIAELIREQRESQGLVSLFRSNLRLLSRKIVERTGVAGEHYITSTKPEYMAMLKAGFGGGFITVFTTLAKTWVSSLKLPFFWEFFGTGLNYAGSFVTIQLCGFALATKQPSATAAHLAGKLENLSSQDKLDEFINDFKKISRSQVAAAVGNIGMAIPASAAMYLIYRILFGHAVFTEDYAQYTLRSLNPLESFTILYAALTGVWLWLSSIIGGWSENWIVYRRIPDAIALNRGLRARFGPARAEKLAQWVSHSAAAFGSNISLGFLLAAVPVMSRIFGIGLDVRHVTLSTCAMTFAACSLLGTPEMWPLVSMAIVGVIVIGTLNFGVSFYLALTVAARARALNQATVFFLFKEVMKAFVKGPREFFYPR